MTTRRLLLINTVWLTLLGILYTFFPTSVAQTTFPQLGRYFELSAVFQLLGVLILGFALFSFLLRNLAEGSYAEREILLGYTLVGFLILGLSLYHFSIGINIPVPLIVVNTFITFVFLIRFIQVTKELTGD